MSNFRGWLRWQLEGTTRSLSFWGFVLIVSAAVLGMLGVPHMLWIMILGGVMGVVDIILAWYRFSYSIYRMEQDRIVRELERKS